MDPGEAGGVELSGRRGPRRRADDRLARARTPDARQARHRYSTAPRRSASRSRSRFYPALPLPKPFPRTGAGIVVRDEARAVVGDAARAEPEAGELRLPDLRRDAARDERARADCARGRRVAPPPRAHGVRARG